MPIVSSPTRSLPPSGTASGDLSGTYPSPTVAKVNGIGVSGTPAVGYVPTATGASAATWQVPSAADPLAVALGLLNWNYNGTIQTSTETSDSGFIWGASLWLPAGVVVSSAVLWIAQAGAGTAPTHFYAGLANSAGTMLAQSNDLRASASLTTTGPQAFAFNASTTTAAAGLYYVVWLQSGAFGSTVVRFVRGGENTGQGNAFGANPKALIVDSTGSTALPANGNALTLSDSNRAYVVAVA